jgi:hypothetical protein
MADSLSAGRRIVGTVAVAMSGSSQEIPADDCQRIPGQDISLKPAEP